MKLQNSDASGLYSLKTALFFRPAPVIALVLLAITVFLPYSLYKRDREMIEKNVHTQAELIKRSLFSAMSSGDHPEKVGKLTDSLREIGDFQLILLRGEAVIRQFGEKDGQQPADSIETDILKGKREKFSELQGYIYQDVFSFKSHGPCGKCHLKSNGKPVTAGAVLGAAELVLNASEMRGAFIKMIISTMIGLVVAIVALLIANILNFNRNVLEPLKQITANIMSMKKEDFDLSFPAPASIEMAVLVNQLEKTAETLKQKKLAMEKELDKQKQLTEEVRAYALEQAYHIGIKNEENLREIIGRFDKAVKMHGRGEILPSVFEAVEKEQKEITLTNDVSLIKPATFYLTDLIPEQGDRVKRGAVELAMQEAITNAVVHGNLEIDSIIKDEEPEKFEALVSGRINAEPYRDRTVRISFQYSNRRAAFTVADDGKGFDWRRYLQGGELEALLQGYGRGLMIMATFASSIEYNDRGNEVTITFEL